MMIHFPEVQKLEYSCQLLIELSCPVKIFFCKCKFSTFIFLYLCNTECRKL
jgi:hypothetical protein